MAKKIKKKTIKGDFLKTSDYLISIQDLISHRTVI